MSTTITTGNIENLNLVKATGIEVRRYNSPRLSFSVNDEANLNIHDAAFARDQVGNI